MSEKILLEEATKIDSFLGHCLLNLLVSKGQLVGLKEFKITPGPGASVDVDLRINGVEVSFRSFVKDVLEKQFDDIVKREVSKKILETFPSYNDELDKINNILRDAKNNLKDKLFTMGYLTDYDREYYNE